MQSRYIILVTFFLVGILRAAADPFPAHQIDLNESTKGLLDLECHFLQEVPATTAETVLRAEINKLSPARVGKREVMGTAWVESRTNDGTATRLDLPDGSFALFREPGSDRIITEKEKDAAALPPVPSKNLINVAFTVSAHRLKNSLVSIVGGTNLPDGTKLIVSFVNGGDADATVRGGRFETAGFGHGGQPYPSGSYEISITMPFARFQPRQVADKIGTKGENLGGKCVVLGLFGQCISYRDTIQVD